jgi:hypothetical protein
VKVFTHKRLLLRRKCLSLFGKTQTSSKEATPVSLTEETAQQLIPLLEEVKGLLKEMSMAATTSGQIGTNLAGPQDDESFEKVEKSYGYKKSTRSKMSGDSTKKAILKSSIANKLKRKY